MPAMDAIDERLARSRPCTPTGWTVGGYATPIWTPLGFVRRRQAYTLVCRGCGRRRDAPLQALVDAGLGDRPMHTFRWRCDPPGGCGGRDIGIELGAPGVPAP